MRGTPKGPFEPDFEGPESRRLTPSAGLAPPPESEAANDSSNEDFLFHLYRGSELLQDDRVHEAKEELERALHLQPRDTKGQDLLAVVYFRTGMYSRAIAIYEKLRRKSPRDSALLLNLALCYLKTGQPALAKRDLEQLLEVNPSHTRAWGYLGLACERLGELAHAELAFQHGGHGQMARRMADRRASMQPPAPANEFVAASPHDEVREVATAAFEELDAGELSFALAEQAPDSAHQAAPNSWHPVELGQQAGLQLSDRPVTVKPDTRDGPAGFPHLGEAHSVERRPTLIVGVPPAPDVVRELALLEKFPSPKPPNFGDEARPAPLRVPAVAVPPVRLPTSVLSDAAPSKMRTLKPPRQVLKPPSTPPVPADQLTREAIVDFPKEGSVLIHASGVALIRVEEAGGFAARLESIRAHSNALAMAMLERNAKGKPTGESFGGVGSPVAHVTGVGQLVLAPRAGRKLTSFVLGADTMCFVREDVLLGFDGELAFENGKLATGEGEFVSIVQLRGKGAVLVETTGAILALDVQPNRGVSARRDVILGWFGRLVPRALAANDAPCGQRGLVSFAGEGRVLVAST